MGSNQHYFFFNKRDQYRIGQNRKHKNCLVCVCVCVSVCWAMMLNVFLTVSHTEFEGHFFEVFKWRNAIVLHFVKSVWLLCRKNWKGTALSTGRTVVTFGLQVTVFS